MAPRSRAGSGRGPRMPAAACARGFTYLGILIVIALLGVALAAVGTLWSTTLQREREADLLFVGEAYRSAIESYYRHGPGVAQLPQELEDLLRDPRLPVVQRYLRRLYADPMTGRMDWEIVRDPGGGIIGVHSSSQGVPIKRANFPPKEADFADVDCYCQWVFAFNPTRGRR